MPSLADVAEINPRIDREQLRDTAELASFVPMANVSETSGAITAEECRQVGELLKGFTPFLDRDLLVAKITPCFENGKIVHARISKQQGFGSTEFHVIRPDPQWLDDRYLFHFLRQPRIRIEGERRMTGSAGQRRVPKAYLESLEIPVPPLAEQRRIAAILDKAQALRAKRREAIAKIDQLLRSIFFDMFGDPIANQKGWPVVSMESLTTGKYGVKAGPFGSALKKEFYKSSGYRVYGQEQVIAGSLDIGDYYIDQERFESLRSCEIASGDLLISLVGSFGKILIVPEKFSPGIINPRLLKLTPDRSRVVPEYLQQHFQIDSVQRHLKSLSHGGTMGILNAGLVKKLSVPLPPMALQTRFLQFLDVINRQYCSLKRTEGRTDDLFQSLQLSAFSGLGRIGKAMS